MLRHNAVMDVRERPFPFNHWYTDAIIAAVDLPDLAGFLNRFVDRGPPSMGSNHVLPHSGCHILGATK